MSDSDGKSPTLLPFTFSTPSFGKRCPACDGAVEANLTHCTACGAWLELVATATTDPNLGREVDGKFLIQRELGHGGMGLVYEATHLGLSARVALKLLPASIAREPTTRERFRNEARTTAQIRHPAVVRVLDFGETSAGELYLAMELIEGTSLEQLLTQGGPLAPQRALALTGELLEGLVEAHRVGVVHRDLKPANLIIEKTRRGDRLRIIDFGIARATVMSKHITTMGELLGTPGYISPEQIMGEPASTRSDLYAVGVVLHELLTGTDLFPDCPGVLDKLRAHLERPAPSVTKHGPGLERLLARALMRNPTERFASAAEFLAEVQRVAAGLDGGLTWTTGHPPAAAELVLHLQAIEPRRRGVRAIVGGAGTGKTALARAAATALRASGRRVLEARARASFLPRPLEVARQLVMEALGATRLSEAAELVDTQPAEERFGLRVVLDQPQVSAAPYLVRRREARAAFAALLHRTDADVIIEDAHALDAGSALLIKSWLRSDGGARTVLFTSRHPLSDVPHGVTLPPREFDRPQDVLHCTVEAQQVLAMVLCSEQPVELSDLARAIAPVSLEASLKELRAVGIPLSFGVTPNGAVGVEPASPSLRFAWLQRLNPQQLKATRLALFHLALERGDTVSAASLAFELDGVSTEVATAERVEALRIGAEHLRLRFDDGAALRALRCALDLVRLEPQPGHVLKNVGAMVAEGLARLARYRGDLVAAELFLREAQRTSDLPSTRVLTERSLGRLAREWGLDERADESVRRALHLAHEANDPQLLSHCFADLLEARVAQNRVGQWSELGSTLEPLIDGQSGSGPSRLRLALAAAAALQGRPEATLAQVRAILEEARTPRPELVEPLLACVSLAARAGDLALAADVAHRASELAERMGDRLARAHGLRALGMLDDQRRAEAFAEARRLEALFEHDELEH